MAGQVAPGEVVDSALVGGVDLGTGAAVSGREASSRVLVQHESRGSDSPGSKWPDRRKTLAAGRSGSPPPAVRTRGASGTWGVAGAAQTPAVAQAAQTPVAEAAAGRRPAGAAPVQTAVVAGAVGTQRTADAVLTQRPRRHLGASRHN